MMKLRDNPKFKEDLNRYQQEISEIADDRVKAELKELLLMFTREAAAIDMHHDTLLINGRMPSAVSESRDNLASIKKKLDAKLSSLPKKS